MTSHGDMVKFISLLPTPLLIFISSAVPIFLRNQLELAGDLSVFVPLLLPFLIVVCIGLVISRYSERPLGNFLLGLYYLLGPAFLLYSFLRGISALALESSPGFALYTAFVLLLTVLITRRFQAKRGMEFFAILGILLLVADGVRLVIGLDSDDAAHLQPNMPIKLATGSSKGSNIYHLIFDAYQSDLFSIQLNHSLEEKLSGFIFYRNALARYTWTNWSIPSVFLGEVHNVAHTRRNREEYQRKAFNSEHSILADLKSSDYATLGIMRKLYPFTLRLFDTTVAHSSNIASDSLNSSRGFAASWAFRVMPEFAIGKMAEYDVILDSVALNQLQGGTYVAESTPDESMLSFINFIRQEQDLPALGRYTFVHLILPHTQLIFDDECRRSSSATIHTQSRCASHLLVKFIDELKRLDRFENSLIIAHSDHGMKFDPQDGHWLPHRSRRSLMLVKPAGRNDLELLEVDESPVAITRIASGIRQFLRSKTGKSVVKPWWVTQEPIIENNLVDGHRR